MSELNDAEDYMNDPAVNAAMEDADEIERLRERIEELEKSLKARFRGDYDGEGIFITDAQIDLAWDQRREAYGKVWLRADYFGIVRCEGCPDCKKIVRDQPWGIPGCGEHGWVKK